MAQFRSTFKEDILKVRVGRCVLKESLVKPSAEHAAPPIMISTVIEKSPISGTPPGANFLRFDVILVIRGFLKSWKKKNQPLPFDMPGGLVAMHGSYSCPSGGN